MAGICNIRIESFSPSEAELLSYALAFKEALFNWHNFMGEPIYNRRVDTLFEEFADMVEEEDAIELRNLVTTCKSSSLISLLIQFNAIPEKLYRITEISTGESKSLPIYTGIRQISLEGNGCVLAEAFFGTELHLLDTTGQIISQHDDEFTPQLGIGEIYLIDNNSRYDRLIKGRYFDSFVDIVDYRKHTLDIRDFTIQYNTFPNLDDRDKWLLKPEMPDSLGWINFFLEHSHHKDIIESYLHQDSFLFQFMPIEIRSDKFWVEKFCLKAPVNFLFVDAQLQQDKNYVIELIKKGINVSHQNIYPYISESLRKDIDILKILKASKSLFELPDLDEKKKDMNNDVCSFITNNIDRIDEIIYIFPNAFHYAPKDLLDHPVIIKAIQSNESLYNDEELPF